MEKENKIVVRLRVFPLKLSDLVVGEVYIQDPWTYYTKKTIEALKTKGAKGNSINFEPEPVTCILIEINDKEDIQNDWKYKILYASSMTTFTYHSKVDMFYFQKVS